MAFSGLLAILAQVPPPGGSGWQGWVFIGIMIGLPIVLARFLSRK
jgi:hypothetical protein